MPPPTVSGTKICSEAFSSTCSMGASSSTPLRNEVMFRKAISSMPSS